MSKGNEPAYPVKKRVLDQCASMKQGKEVFADVVSGGLTKRELLAAMAMQGLTANPETFAATAPADEHEIARWSVQQADALLSALEAK